MNDPFNPPLLDFGVSTLIDTNEDIKMYKCDFHWFVKDVLHENYIYQRMLNDDHVNNLYKAYNSKKNIFVHDGFKLANFNNKFYLIDGQHRLKALEKLNQTKTKNLRVLITIYTVKNISELQQLFKELNNGIPINIEELIEDKYLAFVEELSKFRNEITEHDTAKEGFISKRRLAQFLQAKNILDSKNSTDDIINIIKKKNINMADDPLFLWVDALFEPTITYHWVITEKTRNI